MSREYTPVRSNQKSFHAVATGTVSTTAQPEMHDYGKESQAENPQLMTHPALSFSASVISTEVAITGRIHVGLSSMNFSSECSIILKDLGFSIETFSIERIQELVDGWWHVEDATFILENCHHNGLEGNVPPSDVT